MQPLARRAFRPAGPDGPDAAGVSRAQQIKNAALGLFAARGFAATTIEDIGERVGIRGPSVYKHFRSKQLLLVEIMTATMDALLAAQRAALAGGDGPAVKLRRAVEAHVRYHARHALEAFVGNREIGSLDEPYRTDVLDRRARYEHTLRELIASGIADGQLRATSARLVSYALLDMGIGVAMWYRPDGPMTEDEIVYAYGEMALRIAGAD